MTPRKPRLAQRAAFYVPCKACALPYQPTEYQIQTSRSYLCPACIAARVEAARAKRELREDSPARMVGRDLEIHLQTAWNPAKQPLSPLSTTAFTLRRTAK